ncbi:MAG: PAS domain-containing hybrid sensor histidine kinase/response regulator [Thermodesulfobacteriota bacterium]
MSRKHLSEQQIDQRIEYLQTRLAYLEEQDRKFRLITEHIPDLIWFISAERLCVTYITPSVEKLLGYTPEEVLHLDFKDILIPESYTFAINYLLEELERIRAGQSHPSKVHTFEIGYIAKDQSTVWAEITAVGYLDREGQFREILGVSRDITERKKAEEALKHSEERYRTLFETSMDAIYITSTDGRFIEANPAAVELFGFDSKKALMQTPIQDMYLDLEQRRAFQTEIETQGFVKDFPVRFQKRDGTPMDCLLTSTTWQSEDGTEKGYQGIIRDITEQNRLKAQLLQAQKMEAVGTLAGGIAHNFNNILMTIQGNTSLMLMKTDPEHPHYQKLQKVEQYIEYGSELSNQLLGFARGNTSEMKKSTDLNRLIKNSAHMFSRSKKEVTVETDLGETLWPVSVDQGQIEQVLMNLFVNAWQAMPEGGKISVESRNIELSEYQLAPYQVRAGRYVKISVADMGVGMDAETREKVFDPFFTTKKHGEGTGLGLSTVYGIIKQHEGYVNVYSEVDEGTTFKIYLPAVEKADQPDAAPFQPEAPLSGNETILLIDDEPIIKETGQTMLEELGYFVLTAESGQAAESIFRENVNTVDLVILDMIMPDMSGSDTYDRLKTIDPDACVLLSSGYGLNGQATAILDRGCNGFIQKPFNLTELSRKIREILDGG